MNLSQYTKFARISASQAEKLAGTEMAKLITQNLQSSCLSSSESSQSCFSRWKIDSVRFKEMKCFLISPLPTHHSVLMITQKWSEMSFKNVCVKLNLVLT